MIEIMAAPGNPRGRRKQRDLVDGPMLAVALFCYGSTTKQFSDLLGMHFDNCSSQGAIASEWILLGGRTV
jgi:hypothetical protein